MAIRALTDPSPYKTNRGNQHDWKKNLVFGFLYLVLTASLGPVMIIQHFPAQAEAESAKQAQPGKLQEAVGNDFLNENLDSMTADQIARANSLAILGLSARLNTENPITGARSAHAHGNLEALLNIAVGFLLCFVSISVRFSWAFIAGAVLHSGLLYLAVGIELDWALGLLYWRRPSRWLDQYLFWRDWVWQEW